MAIADLVGKQRTTLCVAGALLLVVAAWMAATAYAKPMSHTEQHARDAWHESSSFRYAVPVTRNSTHWPIGTVLPMGMPAYFRTISDSIQVEHQWAPSLPDARGVAAGSLVAHVEARDPEGRAYWSIEHALAEATTDDPASGLVLAGVVDLDALANEVAVLGKEAPTEGALNWSVRATIVYAFETAHGREQGGTTDILFIGAIEPRYVLPGPDALAWERPHAQVETVTTSMPAGAGGVLRSVPTLALGLVGALLLGAGLATTLAGARDEGFEREYRRHKEWVSVAGAIPEHARDPSFLVDVSTLDDLVSVAADARTRVLLDARTREFFALLPGVTYRYARHATTP